ncbi:type IV pilus biogenesis protein PilM [Sporosarcina sp. 6E9]|uniref:type IV pilus biogenesis protein PilM n=1 Tax=Sporosarcina sp. 6E9 TaxID=2819235 RepID=UPI001B31204E|nr:pilus assembly protein PilM [Sporosarcina sp. 6E9]
MFRRNKNRVVSIEMNDYVIRGLITQDGDLETAKVYEYALPPGVIVDEVLVDELAFFELLKNLVKDWNISRHDLRFFVPDHSVMMRTFDHPKELASNELKGYVEMELGRTIHLPFEDPLLDVYDHVEGDGEAVIYASSSEEVVKVMQLYHDLNLHPKVLDVRMLSIIRFLKNVGYLTTNRTFLVADWSINALSISIYSNENVDFLRYHSVETPDRNWTYAPDLMDVNLFTYDGEIEEYKMSLSEQVLEVERILNFYRFSLNKGEKSVDQIVLVGDNPEMPYIQELLEATIDMPVNIIDDAFVKRHYNELNRKHVALIGLSLKEEDALGS